MKPRYSLIILEHKDTAKSCWNQRYKSYATLKDLYIDSQMQDFVNWKVIDEKLKKEMTKREVIQIGFAQNW